MKVALYKGPAKDWRHKVAHWAVCVATRSPYSHCELVIDGVCWSASARDGGVRGKVIDLVSQQGRMMAAVQELSRRVKKTVW